MTRETIIALSLFRNDSYWPQRAKSVRHEHCPAITLTNDLRNSVDDYAAGLYGIEAELLRYAISNVSFEQIAAALLMDADIQAR